MRVRLLWGVVVECTDVPPLVCHTLLLFCDTSVCNSCCIVVDGLLIMSTSMDALLEGVNAEFGGIKQQVPPRPRPSPHLLSPGLLILTRVQLHLPQSWECPWDQRAVCALAMPPLSCRRSCPLLPPPSGPASASALTSPLWVAHKPLLRASVCTCPWETIARTQSTSQGLGQAWARPRRAPGRARVPGPRYPLLSPTHSPTVAPPDLAPAAPHPAL